MVCTFEQIQQIVLKNPNKALVDFGIEQNTKLAMHVDGRGMKEAIEYVEYFASKPLHAIQKKYAISNKDVFGRLLQQEDMVFSARGGSSYFRLPTNEKETLMNAMLQNVRFGISLRKWVKTFGIKAYRTDPMGIVFMEVEPQSVSEDGNMIQPNAYPTYKSITCIYDYLPTGRRLEYVCFRLEKGEALKMGITDEKLDGLSNDAKTDYFRLVDDVKDIIVKRDGEEVRLVTNIKQKNPVANNWNKTPGFIISDLMLYTDPKKFLSPLDLVVELADCFLFDRSVRDLQKKYHGFAKAVEPMLQCPTCDATGYVEGEPCPSCTMPGQKKGTGYKLNSKVSDVAKFPISLLEEIPGFDFKRLFGYVTPDIDSWNKQDDSLNDLEQLMELTYWGTVRMKKAKSDGTNVDGQTKTATEVDSNEAPKESKLNMIADWCESTENMIATFIGSYWFDDDNFQSSINYGRDYVLRSPDELMNIYTTLRSKGAPDFTLDEALEKYYKSRYQNNPLQLEKYLKMLDVEPFPHLSIMNAKSLITDFTEYNCKLYFGEWANTVVDIDWIKKKPAELIAKLKEYVIAKGLKEPAPDTNAVLN